MIENYTRNPNTICAICAKPIYRRPSKTQKGKVFCSITCSSISQRKETPCAVCGIPILAQFHKKTCSRSCANVHRAGIKYKINSPKDKVKFIRSLKLRLLKERGNGCGRCNYSKVEILQVHHIDRNRENNDLSNLELICPNCHYEEHFLKKSWLKDITVSV